jgi:hypothetical protein
MMQGRSAPLLSSFKLSYYTLLNLLRRIEGSGAFMLPVFGCWRLPLAANGPIGVHLGLLQSARAWPDFLTLHGRSSCVALHYPGKKPGCVPYRLPVLQVPTWSL